MERKILSSSNACTSGLRQVYDKQCLTSDIPGTEVSQRLCKWRRRCRGDAGWGADQT